MPQGDDRRQVMAEHGNQLGCSSFAAISVVKNARWSVCGLVPPPPRPCIEQMYIR